MSISHRHFSNKKKLFKSSLSIKLKPDKRSYSVKFQSDMTLSKNLYKKDTKVINENLLILNYIMNCSQKKFSAKTSLTDSSPENLKYDLTMINKFEEDINTSLSFISNFDLEDIYIDNNSFNSEEDDNENYEIIENKTKTNKEVVNYRGNDDEVNDKLEKDFLDLKNFLLGNM
jgi:hypothetical protein